MLKDFCGYLYRHRTRALVPSPCMLRSSRADDHTWTATGAAAAGEGEGGAATRAATGAAPAPSPSPSRPARSCVRSAVTATPVVPMLCVCCLHIVRCCGQCATLCCWQQYLGLSHELH